MTGPSWDLSEEVSPLGAGGWPKAEIHHPPPLPWAGRSYDHRYRARTVPTQIGFTIVIIWVIFWRHQSESYKKYLSWSTGLRVMPEQVSQGTI